MIALPYAYLSLSAIAELKRNSMLQQDIMYQHTREERISEVDDIDTPAQTEMTKQMNTSTKTDPAEQTDFPQEALPNKTVPKNMSDKIQNY